MDSRELGLVAAQQLTGIEDLHYGLWEKDETPSLLVFKEAQNRYTNFLLDAIKKNTEGLSDIEILDVGCGTGVILKKLLELNYRADGVIPAPYLKKQVDARLAEMDTKSKIYECKFEDFPESDCQNQYDIILFSESYQYIPMSASFPLMKKLLKPGGKVIICDFFKTEHHGDRQPGDKSFGGGHLLSRFYEEIEPNGYQIVFDEDITPRVSPNIALMDQVLMTQVSPTLHSISLYMEAQRPLLFSLFKRIFRKKLEKIKFKYFSGHRSQAVFERYKSYHLVVLGLS